VLHERVDAAFVVTAATKDVVLQDIAEDLREVRLARAEEPRYPHPHDVPGGPAATEGLAREREGIDDPLQLVFDLVGDHVLAHLAGERGSIEDLDDTLDLDPDVALDDFPYRCHSAGLPRPSVVPDQRQNSLIAR
jgi:hypothetical protein